MRIIGDGIPIGRTDPTARLDPQVTSWQFNGEIAQASIEDAISDELAPEGWFHPHDNFGVKGGNS